MALRSLYGPHGFLQATPLASPALPPPPLSLSVWQEYAFDNASCLSGCRARIKLYPCEDMSLLYKGSINTGYSARFCLWSCPTLAGAPRTVTQKGNEVLGMENILQARLKSIPLSCPCPIKYSFSVKTFSAALFVVVVVVEILPQHFQKGVASYLTGSHKNLQPVGRVLLP